MKGIRQTLNRRADRFLVGVLALLLPILMGGCEEFASDVVNAVDTFTRTIVNAALDLFFDQFRDSGTF